MPEQQKRFRIHLRSKAGDQFVTLLARDKGEAELLAQADMNRRAGRYDITFQRLNERHEAGELTKAQLAAEVERRAKDFSRYNVITGGEVGAAEAPLKIFKIEELK